MNASASSLFVYSPLATAGVLVASTTSAPTPVPAAPPSLKPVPSSIFLPLRLSVFLFSFTVSSALIDFKIEVNELISLAFASTSCWEAEVCNKVSAAANLLVASFIIDCWLELFLILSSWAFSSPIFCNNKDLSDSCCAFSVVCGFSFSATASTTFSRVFSVFFSTGFTSTVVVAGASNSLESANFLLLSLCCTVALSLASTTPAQKNRPTPIKTLAAPILNFLIE